MAWPTWNAAPAASAPDRRRRWPRLAPALVAMVDDLRRVTAPHGHLIVSGLLAERDDEVVEALRPMRVVDRAVLDGWSAVVLAHQCTDR